jgi:DNA modification methylase
MPTRQVEDTSPEKKQRIRYTCERCSAETDALSGTERLEKQLCRTCYGKGKDRRKKQLNHLSGKEWASFSISVEEYPDTRSRKQKLHGACFPESLARQQIRIFTKRGETVLDPFVGVGTTLDVAKELERRGIGLDINPDFIEIAKSDIGDDSNFRLICDDIKNLPDYVKSESIDFVLTSPPYANLLKKVKDSFAYKWQEHSKLDPISNPRPYTSSPRDFGNMSYENFLEALEEAMKLTFDALKSDAYAVWVVKDFRDLEHGKPYVNLHGDVIQCGENAGFTLWDIKIYDQTRFRPLVCLGYPSRNFYLNIGHSYMLTFKKV